MWETAMPFWESGMESQQRLAEKQMGLLDMYSPYYEQALKAQQGLTAMQTGMLEKYMPQWETMLPLSAEALQETYYPLTKQTGGVIGDFLSGILGPGQRREITEPFGEARKAGAERAAGRGMLGAGPTQKLMTLYDIAEAEALGEAPRKRQEAVMPIASQFLGMMQRPPSLTQMPSAGYFGSSVAGQPSVGQAYTGGWPTVPIPPTTQEIGGAGDVGVDWGGVGQTASNLIPGIGDLFKNLFPGTSPGSSATNFFGGGPGGGGGSEIGQLFDPYDWTKDLFGGSGGSYF